MNKKFKIAFIILTIILVLCGLICCIKFEKKNIQYIEMEKIKDSNELIGLSKEEVVELLGEPKYEYNNSGRNFFSYDGGQITTGLFFCNITIIFDCVDVYEFRVAFDESGKATYTSFNFVP